MSQTYSSGDSGGSTALDLDLSGRQLGDYRLLRRLGRGAMADVYLAEQGSLRRQVALKALKRELAADATYVRRFHLEAQAAAALVHANIVQIYEVGCIDGLHYIAQEYVEGQNLSQFLRRHRAPDVKLALAIMRQVTAALSKAAERSIVHRDIKPENIMMARSGEVKVADFGLARTTGADDAVKLTQAGITMGTPLYMSPEQVEGRSLDSRSDIYSLGVTCYHMLTGEPPFRGDTALSVALQHVRTKPGRLENLRPDLPPALCRIIHTMLAKDPKDRFQNPRDLMRELRELQFDGADTVAADFDDRDTAEVSIAAATRSEAAQRLQDLMKTQSLALPSRRWVGYSIAGALVALALGAGAAWALRDPFLLDVPAGAVPRQPSALAQYNYASILRTEAAWKSVDQYFPSDTRFVPQAEMELAKLYVVQPEERQKARILFDKFADYPDIETKYRAFGIAGQALVYSLEGQPKESAEKLGELAMVIGSWDPGQWSRTLDDPQMVRSIGRVIRKNREELDQQHATQWDAFMETNFSDEAS